MPPLDYRFVWNNYDHPALLLAYDMSTRTPGGLMKNLARTGALFDATINGALVLAPPLIRAKRTPCMDLDGVNNYLLVPNVPVLVDTSIEAWINVDNLNTQFISERAGFNRLAPYLINTGGPGTVVYFNNAGGLIALTKNCATISTTFHIVCIFRAGAGNFVEIWSNGKLWIRAPSFAANDVLSDLYIGSRPTPANWLNGRMDNYRLWTIALTPEQVQSIYKSANPRM